MMSSVSLRSSRRCSSTMSLWARARRSMSSSIRPGARNTGSSHRIQRGPSGSSCTAIGISSCREATVGFFKNGTARFFGIGGQTSPAQETNYTDRELLGHITTGFYVGPSQRVLWTERLRNVEIQPGVVPDLPFTQSVFPAVKGTGGATVLGHQLAYLNDTRDDTVTPTIGHYFSMFAELAQTLTGSTSTVFSRYGVEYRMLIPNATKQYIFVFRGRLEATV